MNRKIRSTRWHKALRTLPVPFLLIASLAIASLAFVSYRPGVTPGVVKAASGAIIVSDQLDYSPGATVTLTGAGWDSGEAVHIYVNDAVGNTWSLNSNPDPVADSSGGFTYSFSLPSDFIANYAATATGPTSGTATTTFTDSDAACPSLSGKLAADTVSASFTTDTSGHTATYTFSSLVNENPPLGTGVPGLIKYCVYAAPLPNSDTVAAVGANGTAWGYTSGGDNFSFSRPGGNPTNIPLDGRTNYTMGTATWSGSVPTDQTILLHINDSAECAKLYGGNPGTCFVLPGTGSTATPTPVAPTDTPVPPTSTPTPKDLTVSKSASPSFTRTYTWGISKSVNKTEIDTASSATFNYTVSVTHDGGTNSGWQVNGTITVNNPNGFPVSGVNVTDAVDNGGSCTVTAGSGVSISTAGSVNLPYTCTYSSAPTSSKGTNTATATYSFASGSASGSADSSFTTPTTIVDGSVTVKDTLGGALGTVSYSDPSLTTFPYPITFSSDPAGTCTRHDNTATFTTSDSATTGSDSKTVKVCVGKDLTVTKDATPSFTRTYGWSIAKSVDKTLVEQIGGGTATFKYTVKVNETGFTDSAWKVTGQITVSNPNDWEAITANVADAVGNGGACTIDGGGTGLTVAASDTTQATYTCTYVNVPNPAAGTNTATASWDLGAAHTPDGLATGTHDFAFGDPTTRVNQTVTVQDTFNGGTPTTLGTLTAADVLPYTSATYPPYAQTVNVPANNCLFYKNKAVIVETGDSDSKTVEVCGPAQTGALTMGFWQNKNGQTIIQKYSGTTCQVLATWLEQFHPFSDLSSYTTCGSSPSLGATSSTGVVGYVYNVIKAATCTSTTQTCNAMLKAQMLASALDVYFSDPALGNNKISAPAPIGGVKIDLTHVSSAFGGATSLTVVNMLLYQNTSDPLVDAGAKWYGQVKATQVLAKDAFDAINNQIAFAP